jgi:hypothetical protein
MENQGKVVVGHAQLVGGLVHGDLPQGDSGSHGGTTL